MAACIFSGMAEWIVARKRPSEVADSVLRHCLLEIQFGLPELLPEFGEVSVRSFGAQGEDA